MSLSDIGAAISALIGGATDFITTVINLFNELMALLNSTIGSLTIYNVDNINESMHSTVTELITYSKTLYDILIPVGCMFIFINFCVHLTEILMDDEITLEKFIKLVLTLIIGMLLLDNGHEIIMKVYDVICKPNSGSIVDMIMGSLGPFAVAFNSTIFEETLTLGTALTDLVNALSNIVLIIPMWIVNFLFSLIAYTFIAYQIMMRAIKISIYIAFSPIAMSNFFGELDKSQAIRHFKKIISLFLQGPIILIIIRLTTYLVYGASTLNGFGEAAKGLIVLFVMIAAIVGSEQQAEEMLGV